MVEGVGACVSSVHTVQYGCRVEALQTSKNGATLQLGRGQQLDCLAVVAADGGRSMALSAAGRSPPKLVGQTAIRGIARSVSEALWASEQSSMAGQCSGAGLLFANWSSCAV